MSADALIVVCLLAWFGYYVLCAWVESTPARQTPEQAAEAKAKAAHDKLVAEWQERIAQLEADKRYKLISEDAADFGIEAALRALKELEL